MQIKEGITQLQFIQGEINSKKHIILRCEWRGTGLEWIASGKTMEEAVENLSKHILRYVTKYHNPQ